MDVGNLVLFVLFIFIGVFGLLLFGIGIVHSVRHPSNSLSGYAGAWGLMAIIGSLTGIATVVGPLDNGFALRSVVLVAINLFVQPIMLLLFVGGFHKLYAGLRGQFSYAFRVIPRDQMSATEYEDLRRFGMRQAVAGLVLSAAISFACIAPLIHAR